MRKYVEIILQLINPYHFAELIPYKRIFTPTMTENVQIITLRMENGKSYKFEKGTTYITNLINISTMSGY